MNTINAEMLKSYGLEIDNSLNNYFINATEYKQANVLRAMQHSLSAGGKRIRPVLMLEFYKVCGGKGNILPVACAIEMIHTFSLIHDDLPCMDNDDFRRGKPSCHKAYGEAMALLAGDALATLPYNIISEEAIKGNITLESAVKAIAVLSQAVGVEGMIGGQVLDMEYEGKPVTSEILISLQSMKTGALIKASCVIGCILAGADENAIHRAGRYAECLGQAFQIVDDILDVTSSFEELGKPLGSDAENNKSTFVSVFGLDESKKIAQKLTYEALKELEYFENNSFLVELTQMLLERNK